jgi:ribosomal-protein-alanine N-acetyltransferase
VEGLNVRRCTSGDAAAVRGLAARSPEAADWVPERLDESLAWVAENSAGMAGFLVARTAADEMEILNLAVDPGARRQGVGSALLDAALEHGRSAVATRVFLEVRESNEAARRFYERHGFQVIGRRARYYRHPEEDAVLLGRRIVRAT